MPKKSFAVRLDDDDLAELDRRAEAAGISRSEVIRVWLSSPQVVEVDAVEPARWLYGETMAGPRPLAVVAPDAALRQHCPSCDAVMVPPYNHRDDCPLAGPPLAVVAPADAPYIARSDPVEDPVRPGEPPSDPSPVVEPGPDPESAAVEERPEKPSKSGRRRKGQRWTGYAWVDPA